MGGVDLATLGPRTKRKLFVRLCMEEGRAHKECAAEVQVLSASKIDQALEAVLRSRQKTT